jgi:hypothetical protein
VPELFRISDHFKYLVQRSALGDIEKLYPWQLVNYFTRTSELTVKSRLCMHLANLSISGNFETPVHSDTFYPMCFDVTRDAADLRLVFFSYVLSMSRAMRWTSVFLFFLPNVL